MRLIDVEGLNASSTLLGEEAKELREQDQAAALYVSCG